MNTSNNTSTTTRTFHTITADNYKERLPEGVTDVYIIREAVLLSPT